MKKDWSRRRNIKTLKISLTTAPALVQPSFQKTFYIVTDASSVGISGYLGQGNPSDQ